MNNPPTPDPIDRRAVLEAIEVAHDIPGMSSRIQRTLATRIAGIPALPACPVDFTPADQPCDEPHGGSVKQPQPAIDVADVLWSLRALTASLGGATDAGICQRTHDTLTALVAQLAQADARAERAEYDPLNICLGCGEVNNCHTVSTETPSGTEYDLECNECGGNEFTDSIATATQELVLSRDTLAARLAEVEPYRTALEQRMIGSNMGPLLTGNADADLMRFVFHEQEIALSPEVGTIAELKERAAAAEKALAEINAKIDENIGTPSALRHAGSSVLIALSGDDIRAIRRVLPGGAVESSETPVAVSIPYDRHKVLARSLKDAKEFKEACEKSREYPHRVGGNDQ